MAKYLMHGNYVGEGVKGLMQDGGSGRRDAIEKLVTSLGGTLESVYYAFGGTDAYITVDLPNNVAAAAASLVTNATGAVNVSVTVLLTPEEMDEAARMTPEYSSPGS